MVYSLLSKDAKIRLSLLMKILQDEEQHSTLSVAYDEITGYYQKMTMTTRSAAYGEITSVYAASHVCIPWWLPTKNH